MRTKIVAALTAVTLAVGAVAIAAPVAGAETVSSPVVAAAPHSQATIANAKKAKRIVVKAKIRKAPLKLNTRDYLRLLDGFIEVKDRDMAKAGIVGLMGLKEGASASKPLWKAKRGQRVRIVRANGKKLNLKVVNKVKLSKIGVNGPTESQLANVKAVIVLTSVRNAENGRVIFLN